MWMLLMGRKEGVGRICQGDERNGRGSCGFGAIYWRKMKDGRERERSMRSYSSCCSCIDCSVALVIAHIQQRRIEDGKQRHRYLRLSLKQV
jgi:hypothetical protein